MQLSDEGRERVTRRMGGAGKEICAIEARGGGVWNEGTEDMVAQQEEGECLGWNFE